LVVALALSVALHEVLAGVVRPYAAPPEPARESIRRITIARRTPPARPTPAPKPPSPPPPTISPVHAIAAPAARREAIHRNGAPRAAAPAPLEAPAVPAPVVAAPVVATVAGGAPDSGAGAGAGDAAGAGSPGDGGNGTGSGGNEPCGAVIFSNPHGSRYDAATHGFFVDIRMSVRFPDGHAESSILDYPFYYPSEAADPWSDRNRTNPGVPTLMQRPPAEKAAGEPPLVRYVLQHTAADGFTLLRDCPAVTTP
jgi:hypothetical protein